MSGFSQPPPQEVFVPAGAEAKPPTRDDSEVQLAVMPDSLTDALFPGAAGLEGFPGKGHQILDSSPAPGQVGGTAPGAPWGEGEAERQGPEHGQDRPEDRRPPGQAGPAGAQGHGLGAPCMAPDIGPYIMATSDIGPYIITNLVENGNMCPGGN